MRTGFEWFVAWRYLRERGRRSGYVPIGVGVLLCATAGVLFVLAARTKPLGPLALVEGAVDWKQVYQLGGIGALALGILVAVFGYLHTLQSIFTTISTYGVFLGTAALVIVLSVMNGFEEDLRQKILGTNAHLLVTKIDGPFTEWREVGKQIEDVPGVVAYTPYLSSEVVVAANSNYNGVIIKGVDPETVGSVTDLAKNLEEGESLSRLWPLGPDGRPLPPGEGGDSGTKREPVMEEGADGDIEAIDDRVPPPDFSGEGAGDEERQDGPHLEGRGASEDPEKPEDLEDLEDLEAIDDRAPPPDFSGEGTNEKELAQAVGEGAPAGSGARDSGSGADDPEPFVDEEPSDAGLDLKALTPTEIGPRAGTSPGGTTTRRRPRDPRVDALDGILVGRELARNLHLYVGQEVQVVSPLGEDTPAGQIPRTRPFRVAGVFYSGMYEYDTKFVYVTLPALQRFLSMGDEVAGIEIKVRDLDDTQPVVADLTARLGPGYRVQDWKELNRNLFSALKLEKIAMFLVLTIIILVASFSIVSNLIMVVVEKAREIAILKSMGASDRGIMRIFMIEGLYIGALGTSFGLAVGIGACWALGRFGLPLDPDVYYIDRLPVAMDGLAIALVAMAGIAISFVATLYPSYVAARLRPVEGLRYE